MRGGVPTPAHLTARAPHPPTAPHLATVTAGGFFPASSRALTSGTCRLAVSSLATFVKSTRLSPSAVMPACAKPMMEPNRLQLR